MMHRRRRGLSLLELMVGTLLVFTAACTLCMVLVSSAHQVVRERSHSEAVQAAQQEAQLFSIAQGWQNFGYRMTPPSGSTSTSLLRPSTVVDQYGSDTVCIGTQNVDPGYYCIRAPALCTLFADIPFLPENRPNDPPLHLTVSTLSESPVQLGVTTGVTTNNQSYVAFVGPTGRINEIVGGGLPPTLLPTPVPIPVAATAAAAPTPLHVLPMGLAANTTGQFVMSFSTYSAYLGTSMTPGVSSWPDTQSNAQSFHAGSPAGVAITPSSGNAMDMYFTCTDGRCICHVSATVSGTQVTGGPPEVLTPPASEVPLVLPVGAAIDSANGVLWVADQGNLCLRYITLGGGTFGPIMRAWGMGRPRGVAVDAAGTVYTADAQNLWIIAPGLAAGAAPVFTRIALPGVGPTGGIGLQGNVQSMAYSNLDNCLYFNCLAPSHVAGWLYKWTPPSAFAVVAPAADSDTTPSGAGSP